MERSEPPSQQKLKKAFQRGNRPFSFYLAQAMIGLATLFLLRGTFVLFSHRLQTVFLHTFSQMDRIQPAISLIIGPIILPIILILTGIWLFIVAAYLVQRGWIWSPPGWGWSKRHPQKRWFFPSMIVIILAVGLFLSIRHVPDGTLLYASPKAQISALFQKIFNILFWVGFGLLGCGIGDFFYQRWLYHNKMKMSPQEKQAEARERDGDAKTKQRMRGQRR